MNTITSTHRRALVASAILSALAFSFATMSRANDDTAPAQVVVKFADLNVSTSQGAAALYRRIHNAAASVCSHMYANVIDEEYRSHKNACLQTVIGEAVIKVNRPELSAVYASKFGVSSPMVLAAAGTR
jgi:UrcA family protein